MGPRRRRVRGAGGEAGRPAGGDPHRAGGGWSGAGGCGGGSGRAADARQGDLRTGEEVRHRVPARATTQGGDRHHPVEGQDRAASVMTKSTVEVGAPGAGRLEPDDLERDALERELRAAVRGEVRFDAGSRALYATD